MEGLDPKMGRDLDPSGVWNDPNPETPRDGWDLEWPPFGDPLGMTPIWTPSRSGVGQDLGRIWTRSGPDLGPIWSEMTSN